MSVHQLTDTHPQPSGWRAGCTCGWWARGHHRDEVTSAFLDHAEGEHGLIVCEDEDGPA